MQPPRSWQWRPPRPGTLQSGDGQRAAGRTEAALPTRLFADYIGRNAPERVAVTIYGIFLLLPSVLLWALWRYAVRHRLVRADMADEEVRLLTQRLTPGLGGYVVLIAAGLFVPVIAVIGYLVIALFYIIPFRRFGFMHVLRRRRPARRGAADQHGESS